jgi:hypothetical protein
MYLGSESIGANIMYHINDGGRYGLRRTEEEESGTRSKRAGRGGWSSWTFHLKERTKSF